MWAGRALVASLLYLALDAGVGGRVLAPLRAPRPASTSAAAAASEAAAAADAALAPDFSAAAAAFGTPSSVSCAGEGAQLACAFRNLYLVGGRLRFLSADDSGGGGDSGSGAWIPDLVLGAPHELAGTWHTIKPTPISRAELLGSGASGGGGGGGGVVEGTPLFLYQRLAPTNIYHHLWDDAATVFSLVYDRFARALAARAGEPLDVRLAFVDKFGTGNANDDVWRAISSFPAQSWQDFVGSAQPASGGGGGGGGGGAGAPVMLAAVFAGSAGQCAHRRHCTSSPAPAKLRAFKRHLLAFFGIAPPPGAAAAAAAAAAVTGAGETAVAAAAAAAAVKRPTALVVLREGRRRILNPGDLVALLDGMGYAAQPVGPFARMSLREQLAAIHNASLVVFLHGAEIGPVWMGLAEGACAGLIFPYLNEETLAWWVGGPLGLRIAPFYEAPLEESDERFRLPKSSATDIIALYNRDMRVDPKRLRNTLWCADARNKW